MATKKQKKNHVHAKDKEHEHAEKEGNSIQKFIEKL